MTPRTAAAVAATILLCSLASGFLAYKLADSKSADRTEATIESRIAGCERAKEDRLDNARGWTKLERGERRDSQDPSGGPGEQRRSAGEAVVFGESANQLRSRLFLCEPLIRDGVKIIDPVALAEAKGEL